MPEKSKFWPGLVAGPFLSLVTEENDFILLGEVSDHLVEVVTQYRPLSDGRHHPFGTHVGSIESIFFVFQSANVAFDIGLQPQQNDQQTRQVSFGQTSSLGGSSA